jgi:hypothetical protein
MRQALGRLARPQPVFRKLRDAVPEIEKLRATA